VLKRYDVDNIALYCFYYNFGRNIDLTPMQLISHPLTFINSVYTVRESSTDPEFAKHWSTWYAECQGIFRKLENDNLLMIVLKKYGFIGK